VSFAWVTIPLLGAYFSTFKDPIFMLLLVATSFWRPWERLWWRSAVPRLAAVLPVGVLLLVLATAWQFAVKGETRRAYEEAAISGSVTDRALFFLNETREALPDLWDAPLEAVESLVTRLSYILFFSRVLEHVPKVEPHSHGELLRMAIVNALMPRFVFPEKPELPSDSYYTNRFSGLSVPETSASISIGYMAEFYADWGVSGMYVSILGYGMLMGLIHRGLRRWVRPSLLVGPALVTVLTSMMEFEHQFIKGFAALNLGFAVIVIITTVGRSWLTRLLTGSSRPSAGAPALVELPSQPKPSF
jgi:hypothetical protein